MWLPGEEKTHRGGTSPCASTCHRFDREELDDGIVSNVVPVVVEFAAVAVAASVGGDDGDSLAVGVR